VNLSTDSIQALQRANPRRQPGYDDMLDRLARAALERHELLTHRLVTTASAPRRRTRRVGTRSAGALSIGAGALVTVLVVAILVAGSPVGSQAVPPAAAMEHAVEVTATAAGESGIVDVEMTQDGELWAAKTVHWNGDDLSITDGDPAGFGRRDLLVVDWMMYGHDPEAPGRWIELGSPDSIDPGTGTTPDDYLTAVHEDAGGETLRRITSAMTDLTSGAGADGSTIYSGHVPAGDLARETGTKDGQTLRVLPYGFVAHDEAGDPSSMIAVSITVGADETIQEISASWGGSSNWTYSLRFNDLGSASELTAPANARPLLACRLDPTRPDC
jgi:hypothetical protein